MSGNEENENNKMKLVKPPHFCWMKVNNEKLHTVAVINVVVVVDKKIDNYYYNFDIF